MPIFLKDGLGATVSASAKLSWGGVFASGSTSSSSTTSTTASPPPPPMAPPPPPPAPPTTPTVQHGFNVDYSVIQKTTCPTGLRWDETQKKCVTPTCPAGQKWDATNNKCIPANRLSLIGKDLLLTGTSTPMCADSVLIKRVQNAIGVTADGKWGPASQAALEKTGKKYTDFSGSCKAPIPCPAGYTYDVWSSKCKQQQSASELLLSKLGQGTITCKPGEVLVGTGKSSQCIPQPEIKPSSEQVVTISAQQQAPIQQEVVVKEDNTMKIAAIAVGAAAAIGLFAFAITRKS